MVTKPKGILIVCNEIRYWWACWTVDRAVNWSIDLCVWQCVCVCVCVVCKLKLDLRPVSEWVCSHSVCLMSMSARRQSIAEDLADVDDDDNITGRWSDRIGVYISNTVDITDCRWRCLSTFFHCFRPVHPFLNRLQYNQDNMRWCINI